MSNYTIVPPLESYPIKKNIHIISGTPYIHLKKNKSLVIGDIHLGHESALFNTDTNHISVSTHYLTQNILDLANKFGINQIICNGDIKHHTQSIRVQEIEELKYFSASLTQAGLNLIFVEGNHDPFLEYMLPFLDENNFKITEYYNCSDILISHGHLPLDESWLEDKTTIILSHEHPAFTLTGHNRARVKLQAFITLYALKYLVVIIPAANSISLGNNFPILSRDKFLSPFLQKYAKTNTMEIFPIHKDFGLFELPPISKWKS